MSGLAASGLDMNKLTDKDKQELQRFIVNESQKSQIQSSIHSLTDICFRKCVTKSIASNKLDRSEEPCMQNCVDRFLDGNNLVLKQLEALRNS